MKKILLAASMLLLNITTHAQGFQIGYAAGLTSNYPDNSQSLYRNGGNTASKVFVQNGLFARYELKRWALHLAASNYNVSYPYFQSINSSNTYWSAEPVNQVTSGITRVHNYLLSLSFQVCLNSNKAIHNPNFKGIRSYVGFSYTGIITHLNGQANLYDAIANTTSSAEYTNNLVHRALGGNYYASYQLSKHLIVSLLASLQFDPYFEASQDADYFIDMQRHDVAGFNPQDYFSLTFGLAYRFSK
ncbi:MAG: hypothetical protein ACTHJ0_13680 [Flavipsychrobacter sp.]